MTWRTIVISSNSKLDLRLGYLVIRNSEIRKVHLSEIYLLLIESTAVSMTAMLLCELTKRKIKIIFCDETHNPYGEISPYYGCHDSPAKLRNQIKWSEQSKGKVWATIVRMKIRNQANLLSHYDKERAEMLFKYSNDVQWMDDTNREGHAAKVYFNTLFGIGFSRKNDNAINACLNYGYSILLSAINREISCLGYSTQLGIFHDNTYNQFNLGSDIIEPLRPLVDRMTLKLMPNIFNTECKRYMAALLGSTVVLQEKKMHLTTALPIYVKSVTDALESDDPGRVVFCEYEDSGDESNSLL